MGWDGIELDDMEGCRGDDESLQTVNTTINQGRHEGGAVFVSKDPSLLSPHVLSIMNRNANVPGQHRAR